LLRYFFKLLLLYFFKLLLLYFFKLLLLYFFKLLLLYLYIYKKIMNLIFVSQVESCRLYTKYAARPASLEHLPLVVERAMRASTHGRPGAVYLDLPGDFLTAIVN